MRGGRACMGCLYFLFSFDVNVKLLQIYINIYICIHIYPWVKDIKDFQLLFYHVRSLKVITVSLKTSKKLNKLKITSFC